MHAAQGPRLHALAAFALLHLSAVSSTARADAVEGASAPRVEEQADAPAAETSPEVAYAAEVEVALLEYERGNFVESREHFRLAHAARPSARTLRGLGKVEFELRHYVEARSLLGAALDSQDNPLDEELRGEVERLLARAGNYVAELEVHVAPHSATVELDGVPLDPGRAHALVVGDHLLEARAPGYITLRRPVVLRGGEQRSVDLALVSSGSPDVTTVPLRDAAPTRGLSSAAKKTVVVAIAAVVLGAAAVGIGLAARDHGQRSLQGGSTGLVLVNP